MYIRVDENNNIVEVSSAKQKGFLNEQYDVDCKKLLFAKLVDGKVVYDDKNFKKHVKNRAILRNLTSEWRSIEDWFVEYDRVCNEHLRCARLGKECHHNLAEWDKLAEEKASRVKEINELINSMQ